MSVACEVAYHNYDPPDWLEHDIRMRIADLARFDARLETCRVRLQHRIGQKVRRVPPVVHIELGLRDHVPIVVSYEPDRLWIKYAEPSLPDALTEAFMVAAQRLSESGAGTAATAAGPLAARPALGQIAELDADHDCGYVLTEEGALLYFHRQALMNGSFDTLQIGETVAYLQGEDEAGPLAARLRVRD